MTRWDPARAGAGGVSRKMLRGRFTFPAVLETRSEGLDFAVSRSVKSTVHRLRRGVEIHKGLGITEDTFISLVQLRRL